MAIRRVRGFNTIEVLLAISLLTFTAVNVFNIMDKMVQTPNMMKTAKAISALDRKIYKNTRNPQINPLWGLNISLSDYSSFPSETHIFKATVRDKDHRIHLERVIYVTD